MRRWAAGFAVVAAASLIMIARTWRGWADPLIDFGRELYTAWQVADGAALYRDVAYFNGPLSPHVNGLLFYIAGPGILFLSIVNIAIYFAITWLSFDLLRRAGDALSATVAGVTLATLFGFIQLVGVGNYNYATPYSHEMTHGLVLSLAAMWCLVRYNTTGRRRWAVLCGAASGLVFLTKVELFAACAAAIAAGLIATRQGRSWRTIWIVLPAAVAPPIIALLLLWTRVDAATALRGVLGGWVYVFNPDVRSLPFYRMLGGFDQAATQLRQIGLISSGYAVAVVLALAAAAAARGRARVLLTGVAVIAPAALAWWFFERIPWQSLFYPLPAVALLLAGTTAAAAWRRGADEGLLARLMWCVFATVLLAKIILRSGISHYGFVLAMPATLALAAAITGWLPEWLERRTDRTRANVFRLAAVSATATVIAVHLWAFERFHANRPVLLGAGADQILAPADGRAEAAGAMLRLIERVAPPGATLAVVPEGAMLNYLSRRESSTPYVTLLPPEFAMFDAREITGAFWRRPPDFVVIADRDLTEYGSAGFERDYARELAEWLHSNYDPVGSDPAPTHGMTLWARRGRSDPATRATDP